MRGRRPLAMLSLLLPGSLGAAPPAGERISFVSCPLVRDTRTVPCWLSEYAGDTYYRPPGPSAGRLAFAPDPGASTPPPPPPRGRQTVQMYFDFDRGVSFSHPGQLVSVLERAAALPAGRLEITGVRGAHRLSDGTLLRESEAVGRRRAEEIADLLRGAGLDVPVDVEWIDGLAEADGVDDWRTRRVSVVLLP